MVDDRKFIDACMNLDLNSVVNFVEKYGKDYITKKYMVNNVYTSLTPLGAVVITFHPYISNKGINNCLELCKYLIDNGASLYETIERTDWDVPFSIREYMKGKHIFHKENRANVEPELLWFNEIYDTFLNYLEDYERENDEILSVKDPGE
jgi:hypothetical protein